MISLPAEVANVRMRAWRALKSSGAAVLRDGVYLMPELERCRQTLAAIAAEVTAAGGMAHVLRLEQPAGADFSALFDRSAEYAALRNDIHAAHCALSDTTPPDSLKLSRKLRKTFSSLIDIDFFAADAQQQTSAALQALELALTHLTCPDEPHPASTTIERLDYCNFQDKTWATRQRPGVDRLACAWLIRRFIDPGAALLWLENPAACPATAIGFDFDGAHFSHVDARVTFEVLLVSFDLASPALQRLGHLVHWLDVGGLQPPEAAGIEAVLAGLREAITDDHRLLQVATPIFDGLFTSFSKDIPSHDTPN